MDHKHNVNSVLRSLRYEMTCFLEYRKSPLSICRIIHRLFKHYVRVPLVYVGIVSFFLSNLFFLYSIKNLRWEFHMRIRYIVTPLIVNWFWNESSCLCNICILFETPCLSNISILFNCSIMVIYGFVICTNFCMNGTWNTLTFSVWSHIDRREKRVPARMLGPEGGWIVRSYICSGGERNILYKGVETSP